MLRVILNLPYTFLGLVLGLVSMPKSVILRKNPLVIILRVRRLWWGIGYLKGLRATTIGNVVLLSDTSEEKDFDHELVHILQYQREPLIYPLLYFIELVRRGYKNNKYEIEAYEKAGNNYYQ